MNEYQRARRFEDRTRWAPTCLISETDCRPVAFHLLDERMKAVVREAFNLVNNARKEK